MPASAAPPIRRPADKLGLGTAQFGLDPAVSGGRGRLSEAEAFSTVAFAASAGVRLIDTAPEFGEAEAVLGRVRPPAHPFRLITKTARLTEGVDAVEARARASLVRLGVTHAAALLVGDARDLLGYDGQELWRLMQRLKAEGLYETIGISVRGGDDAVEIARRFKPDLMQMPASLLDQRLVRNGALSEVAGLGVEVHLRSIFLQGLIFAPRENLPEPLRQAGPRLSRIRRMVAEAGADLLQAALAFALQRAEASAVIVGVASAAELRAVLAAAGAPPPALDWGALSLDEFMLDAKSWVAA